VHRPLRGLQQDNEGGENSLLKRIRIRSEGYRGQTTVSLDRKPWSVPALSSDSFASGIDICDSGHGGGHPPGSHWCHSPTEEHHGPLTGIRNWKCCCADPCGRHRQAGTRADSCLSRTWSRSFRGTTGTRARLPRHDSGIPFAARWICPRFAPDPALKRPFPRCFAGMQLLVIPAKAEALLNGKAGQARIIIRCRCDQRRVIGAAYRIALRVWYSCQIRYTTTASSTDSTISIIECVDANR